MTRSVLAPFCRITGIYTCLLAVDPHDRRLDHRVVGRLGDVADEGAVAVLGPQGDLRHVRHRA